MKKNEKERERESLEMVWSCSKERDYCTSKKNELIQVKIIKKGSGRLT